MTVKVVSHLCHWSKHQLGTTCVNHMTHVMVTDSHCVGTIAHH